MKRWLAMAALIIGLGMLWTPAGAEQLRDIPSADAAEIHSVVQSQLDALAEDDAVRAFELATPSTRMQIGTPDNFLRLIKELYNPIYRHRGALFLEAKMINGVAIQMVRVTDRSNHVWLAVFWMQQEDDGSWKIDGCDLLETASVAT